MMKCAHLAACGAPGLLFFAAMTTESSPETALVEYQAAQASAQFYDALAWTSSGITWGLSVLLLGFAMNNIAHPVPVTTSCASGLLLLIFQWQLQLGFRSIKNQKYRRCIQLEGQLGMTQHSTLNYYRGSQTLVYYLIVASLAGGWIATVVAAWTRAA
jgi:hypothetical protein